jgi:hypothetical protein
MEVIFGQRTSLGLSPGNFTVTAFRILVDDDSSPHYTLSTSVLLTTIYKTTHSKPCLANYSCPHLLPGLSVLVLAEIYLSN